MQETTKTAVFLGVAAFLTGTALVASIPRSASVEDFNDQGRPFFPEFTDPSLASSLEVVEVDPSTAEARPFKVMFRNGRWVIPSHYDYPADAKDRLERTAAAVIGLTRDTIRSNRTEDHKALGVVDPMDAKSASVEGMGKRIVVRDKSDRVLAEYVVGKDVQGRPGQKYVRRPGQARTYGVNVQVEPSTRFADWIEPNLLGIRADEIRRAMFDNRKVDVARGKLVPGETLTIERATSTAPWTMPGLAPNEEVDPTKTSALVNALADLKIVGVRPKPDELVAALSGDSKTPIDAPAILALRDKGFFLTKDGLYSEEGALMVGTEEGIDLSLQFGRVTFAQGEALSAGSAEEEKAKAKDEAKKEGDSAESRYLFVTAQFNPDSLTAPTPPNATGGGELPGDVFAKTDDEKKADADRADRENADHAKRLADAKKRADEMTKRFAPWYYLVPGDAYRSLVLDRKSLVREKPPEGSTPPGNPFGGGGNPFGAPGARPGRLR